MKYYLDTEFIEGFRKPLFGKRRHFIDLISIGIVCEDGREYYAISNEFDASDADEWVKKNVISKLPSKNFNGSNASEALLWKSNDTIQKQIRQFIYKPFLDKYDLGFESMDNAIDFAFDKGGEKIDFYAYFADYDWVVFCSLFGRMINLPKGFPMYCRDLKQIMDEKGLTKEWKHKNCAEPIDSHNALVDAKWNKKFHELLMKTR